MPERVHSEDVVNTVGRFTGDRRRHPGWLSDGSDLAGERPALPSEASGVAKSTLYAHFRTKEELVAAYLRRTDDSWMSQLRSAAELAGHDAREQLVGLFDALDGVFDRHGFFGCPFVGAAVEAEPDSQARAITLEHTQRCQAWLTELSEKAGAAAPESLAWHIGLLIDGALASGRLLQDRTVVDEAKTAARRLVASHT